MPDNYEEIWKEYVSTFTKLTAKRIQLRDKFPEKTDRLFQDAAHEFMQGKYQIAKLDLERIRSML